MISRLHLLLLSLLYLASALPSNGLEGSVLFLTASGQQPITKDYYISPTEPVVESTWQRPLTGSLATLCGSCLPGAVTALPFHTESRRAAAVVILSDTTLTVLATDHASTQITQMIGLDEECTPHNLVAVEGSPTQFAVVCARQALHIASINTSNFQVTLSELFHTAGNESETAFITSGSTLLGMVTYIGDNTLKVYAVTELTPQVWPLPTNINCTSQPTLYPLNIKEAFMMHCMTERGPTLYVVPLRILGDTPAQTILTEGIPYSSRDGSYILVVDGSRLTVYSSEDTRLPLSQKRLPSTIKSVVNLDNDNVRVLTENGEHVVMNLVNSLAEPRYLPGGPPILSEWVSSSHHYIYLTENGTLYIMNETSTCPLYRLEGTTNRPEVMIFIEGPKPTAQSPVGTPSTTDAPKSDGTDVGKFILYDTVFASILIAILIGCIILIWLVCCCGFCLLAIVKGCISCGKLCKASIEKRKKSRKEKAGAKDEKSGVTSQERTHHEAYEMEQVAPVTADSTTQSGGENGTSTAEIVVHPQEQKQGNYSEADTAHLLP